MAEVRQSWRRDIGQSPQSNTQYDSNRFPLLFFLSRNVRSGATENILWAIMDFLIAIFVLIETECEGK